MCSAFRKFNSKRKSEGATRCCTPKTKKTRARRAFFYSTNKPSGDGAPIMQQPFDLVFHAKFKGFEMIDNKVVRADAKRFFAQFLINVGVFFLKSLNTVFKSHNNPPVG
jgi:hypothetical protein